MLERAAALILAAIVAGPIVQQPATIEGVIVKSGTSDAIPGSGVELRTVSGNSNRYIAIASKDGHFLFRDVAPGEYRLAATHPGFVRSEYGQRGPNGTGVSIRLIAGQELKDIKIALIETGVISGRIYNRNGVPLENVQVQALRFAYKDGRRVLTPVRATITNDLGAYRLFWLPPGDYFMAAMPLGAVAPNLIRQTEAYDDAISESSVISPTGKPIRVAGDEPLLPSYYPGVSDPQAAAAISVKPGGSIGGLDMTLRAGTRHSVSGSVTGMPAPTGGATSPRENRVQIESRGPIKVISGGVLRSVNSGSGTFEFSEVLPGSYDICANSGALYGCTIVDIGGADVTGVRVAVNPNVDVRANVFFNPRAGFDGAAAISKLRLLTIPESSGSALPRPSGEFLFRGIHPGEPFRIRIEFLPETGYIQSIRLGDSNVLESGLRLDRTPDSPIEIVIGLDAGSILGSVVSNSGDAAAAVRVVMAPNDRDRVDLYKTVMTDASGNFRMPGLAPGDYKVFAFEDIEEGAWLDPGYIRKFEELGKSLHISAAEETPVRLLWIPWVP